VVVRVAGPSDAPGVAAVVAAVREPRSTGGGPERAPRGRPAPPRPGGPVADVLVLEPPVQVDPAGVVVGEGPEGEAPAPAVHADAVAEALRRPDVVVLLAEAGERAVGVLVLRRGEVLPLSDVPAAHVDQLAVAPADRRRGVGRALLAAAARAADADGLERIVVSAPPTGREAHRFLARLGFSPLVVQRCASVPALRRSLRAQSAGSCEAEDATRRDAVERLLSRRRRERGLSVTA